MRAIPLVAVAVLVANCAREPPPSEPWVSLPRELVFDATTVGTRTTATLRLENQGLASARFTLETSAPFQAETPGGELAPGSSGAYELSFTPDIPGTATGTLRVVQHGQAQDVRLRGRGLRPEKCVAPGPCFTARLDTNGTCLIDWLPEGTSCVSVCGNAGTCRARVCEGGEIAEEWHHEGPRDGASGSLAADDAGHIYWTYREGRQDRTEALARNGHPLFAFEESDVALIDDVLVSHRDLIFEGRDRHDGRLLWTRDLRLELPASFAGCVYWAYEDGSAAAGLVTGLYSPSTDRACTDWVFALEASTGLVRWSRAVGRSAATSLVASEHGTLFIGGSSGLRAFDARGEFLWQTRARYPAATYQDRILDEDRQLLDATNGGVVATLTSPGYPAVLDDALLLFEEQRESLADHPGLYAFDPVSGKLLWWWFSEARWQTRPILTSRDTLLWSTSTKCDASCGLPVGRGPHDPEGYRSLLREFSRDGREISRCELPGRAPYMNTPVIVDGRWIAETSDDWSTCCPYDTYGTCCTRETYSLHAFAVPGLTVAPHGWVSVHGSQGRDHRAR